MRRGVVSGYALDVVVLGGFVVGRVRDWLELLRAGSAGFILIGPLLMGLVVGGLWAPIMVVWLASWVFAWTVLAMLHNNLVDFPYDAADPHKQGGPLVGGRIRLPMLARVVRVLTVAWSLAALGLAWYASLPIAFLVASLWSLVLLFAYNAWSKRRLYAPVVGALSVSLLSLSVAAFAWVPGADVGPVVFVAVFAFLSLFQFLGFTNQLKDLDADPRGLLRALGARASPDVDNPGWYSYSFLGRAVAYAFGVQAAQLVAFGAYWVAQWGPRLDSWAGFSLVGFQVPAFLFVSRLTSPLDSPRRNVLWVGALLHGCNWATAVVLFHDVFGAWSWLVFAAPILFWALWNVVSVGRLFSRS